VISKGGCYWEHPPTKSFNAADNNNGSIVAFFFFDDFEAWQQWNHFGLYKPWWWRFQHRHFSPPVCTSSSFHGCSCNSSDRYSKVLDQNLIVGRTYLPNHGVKEEDTTRLRHRGILDGGAHWLKNWLFILKSKDKEDRRIGDTTICILMITSIRHSLFWWRAIPFPVAAASLLRFYSQLQSI